MSRYFSTKQLNLIARGWENRKSDSVTFMLDAFLDSTSWSLRSTKRVGLLFSVFTLDFPMKKSISQVNLSHVLPLKRWYPEKHIDRHTIAFYKIRNGIHWFIPDVKLFLKKKSVFGKLIAKKIRLRKCCLPFQKPILSRICFNFLCHTIATAHLSNGTKSHFWSELFHLWTDFKSWYAKIFGMMNVIIRSDF